MGRTFFKVLNSYKERVQRSMSHIILCSWKMMQQFWAIQWENWCVHAQSLNCVQLYDPMACQAPLSMKFSRKEYWSRLPFLTPRNLPDPGIKPLSLASSTLQVESLPLRHPGSSCLSSPSKQKPSSSACYCCPASGPFLNRQNEDLWFLDDSQLNLNLLSTCASSSWV